MAKEFAVKTDDLRRLSRLFKHAPDKMRVVTATILNDFAFRIRDESIKAIKSNLSIKQEKFIIGSIRVQKTRYNLPINRQIAKVGSIERPRFSGLVEQELGTKTERTRVATLLSRGGTTRGTIRPGFRLRGRRLPNPKDYPGRNQETRTAAMLADLKKKKYTKPFVIRRHSKFRPGLYKLKRKKAVLLQYFKPKNLQPKRFKWLTMGYMQAYERIGLAALWNKALKKVFKD